MEPVPVGVFLLYYNNPLSSSVRVRLDIFREDPLLLPYTQGWQLVHRRGGLPGGRGTLGLCQ